MFGELLKETEVAKKLRVSLACLRRWRLEKRGPAFVKIGQLVRYRPDQLELWIQSLPTGGLEKGETKTGLGAPNAMHRNGR